MKLPSIAPGYSSAALGFAGAAAQVIWPNKPIVGYVLLGLAVATFALGIRFDGGGVKLWRWRDRKWWAGLQRISVRKAGCIVANVPPSAYSSSERAQAVADVLRSLVNSGHIPLAGEHTSLGGITRMWKDPGVGIYGRKSVDDDAMISVATLETIARDRDWKLPWPVKALPATA